MADNVVITAGTGTTIHADEYTHGTLGSGKTQLVKLVDGTLNSDTPIGVDVGAKANALRVAPANDITDGTYIGDIKFGESIPAGSNAIGKLAANDGVDIGDVTINNASGASAVNIQDGGNTITVDGTVTANLSATDNAVLDVIAADTTSLDGKVTACNTGAVVLSSGTVTTVSTVTTLSQLGGQAISMGEGVLAAGCQRVTLATDDDGVAHLATIAGDTTNIETAVQIMDDWDATHSSAASADGPQLMAAYDATKPTAVSDGEAVRVLADEYGRLLSGVEKTAWQAVFDSADATAEANVVKASAASTIVVVQSYIISSDVEGWIKLQDEDSTALTGKFWLKAGGGVAITLPDNAPIVLAVDKDLEVIAEVAGNVSVSATGYTIPG